MMVLDRHTAPFFAPEFHSGAVEAELDLHGFRFEARVARDVGGQMRVVLQLEEQPQCGFFLLRSYYRPHKLAQKGASQELWDQFRAVCDPEKNKHLPIERIYFYEPKNFVITKVKYSCGGLIDLNNYTERPAQFGFDYKSVPPGFLAFEDEELVRQNTDEVFAVLQRVASECESELAQTMAYLRADDDFKSRQGFGCSLSTLNEVRSLLRAALIVEVGRQTRLNEGSTKWLYWMEGSRALEGAIGKELPDFLRQWKQRICAAKGCRALEMSIHEYINTTASNRKSGIQHAFNAWIGPTQIQVGPISAHEILEAQLQLREFERAHPR